MKTLRSATSLSTTKLSLSDVIRFTILDFEADQLWTNNRVYIWDKVDSKLESRLAWGVVEVPSSTNRHPP